jgi:mono/diheme cytochrome c family protein
MKHNVSREPSIASAIVVGVAIFGTLLVLEPATDQRAEAYPLFAQATGSKCQTCHTLPPQLNSYGRFLQRTFYAPITAKAMKGILPIFIEEQVEGDSTGGADSKQPSKKVTIGNIQVTVAGFLGHDFTYRLENGLYSGDQPSSWNNGPELMWVAYNNLFGGYGHLQVGNAYPGPVPAFLANPGSYATAYYERHLFVGEHGYNLTNERFGARFDYERGPLDAEVAMRYGTDNPLTATTNPLLSGPGADRAFQWKLADAPPSQPWEFGAYGTVGTYGLHGAPNTVGAPPAMDYYNMYSPYFEVDPNSVGKGVPGVYGFYQTYRDSNPGVLPPNGEPLGRNSEDEGLDLVAPMFNGYGMINAQQEYSNNGIGGVGHYYNLGVAYEIPELPYIFLRLQVPMAGSSSAPYGRPTWLWSVQWITPLVGSQNKIENYAQTRENTIVSVNAPSGESIYTTNCSACHGATGQGTAGAFPALAGNKDVIATDPTAVITIVKHGKGAMPAWSPKLSNGDIASVLTYIRSAWGNKAPAVTAAVVASVK